MFGTCTEDDESVYLILSVWHLVYTAKRYDENGDEALGVHVSVALGGNPENPMITKSGDIEFGIAAPNLSSTFKMQLRHSIAKGSTNVLRRVGSAKHRARQIVYGSERASQKQSSDTHKTPCDRVKRCRERKINIEASERVNVDIKLDPGSELGSFNLGSGKMLVQPCIRRGCNSTLPTAPTRQCSYWIKEQCLADSRQRGTSPEKDFKIRRSLQHGSVRSCLLTCSVVHELTASRWSERNKALLTKEEGGRMGKAWRRGGSSKPGAARVNKRRSSESVGAWLAARVRVVAPSIPSRHAGPVESSLSLAPRVQAAGPEHQGRLAHPELSALTPASIIVHHRRSYFPCKYRSRSCISSAKTLSRFYVVHIKAKSRLLFLPVSPLSGRSKGTTLPAIISFTKSHKSKRGNADKRSKCPIVPDKLRAYTITGLLANSLCDKRAEYLPLRGRGANPRLLDYRWPTLPLSYGSTAPTHLLWAVHVPATAVHNNRHPRYWRYPTLHFAPDLTERGKEDQGQIGTSDTGRNCVPSNRLEAKRRNVPVLKQTFHWPLHSVCVAISIVLPPQKSPTVPAKVYVNVPLCWAYVDSSTRADNTTVRLLAFHQGEPGSIPGRDTPGYSQMGIVSDDEAGRRVFSGIFPFRTGPCIPALLHSRLNFVHWPRVYPGQLRPVTYNTFTVTSHFSEALLKFFFQDIPPPLTNKAQPSLENYTKGQCTEFQTVNFSRDKSSSLNIALQLERRCLLIQATASGNKYSKRKQNGVYRGRTVSLHRLHDSSGPWIVPPQGAWNLNWAALMKRDCLLPRTSFVRPVSTAMFASLEVPERLLGNRGAPGDLGSRPRGLALRNLQLLFIPHHPKAFLHRPTHFSSPLLGRAVLPAAGGTTLRVYNFVK
ncbi:hypothetical protein PR048_021273 [Dryococelus australis]|uniref:Uncharacterized protein n=1 Tax=Dryococelus australis TaxID=614101 RepID=A0ABQ9GXR7_9NEOP|nr:hypothetical protein PR048_021273 [Dryococelus australis]